MSAILVACLDGGVVIGIDQVKVKEHDHGIIIWTIHDSAKIVGSLLCMSA